MNTLLENYIKTYGLLQDIASRISLHHTKAPAEKLNEINEEIEKELIRIRGIKEIDEWIKSLSDFRNVGNYSNQISTSGSKDNTTTDISRSEDKPINHN